MAKILPSSAKLDGFDIDTSQCPPKEWLPENVNIHEFDVFAELPAHLIGKYDIVHLRLFLLIVQNNDPTPLLKKLIQMLSAYIWHASILDDGRDLFLANLANKIWTEPGGYIQWGEYDLASRYIVHAQPSNSSENLIAAINAPTGQKDQRMHPTWVAHLSQTFRESGLTDVNEHRRETERSHLLLHNDVVLLALEEMSYGALDRLGVGRGQALRDSLRKADAECRKGVAVNQDRVTVVARKTLTM